jgi:DNA-binding CsgD family transcriptional regulator
MHRARPVAGGTPAPAQGSGPETASPVIPRGGLRFGAWTGLFAFRGRHTERVLDDPRPAPADLAPGEPLYGRAAELHVLSGLVGGLAPGGGALVLRGEAGMGKSALLAAAARHATGTGARVLTATGVQAEARLPFAGLHQLLRPVLPLAELLPPRLRAALLSAFGLTDAEPAEPFLIGLAALELVSDAAADSPVLLVADDAQWLDEASGVTLSFVARRLAAEPAALLAAVRDGLASPFDDAGLPELRLAGLDAHAAAELLDARSPGLAPALRDRLLAEAAGNPLALTELPKAVRSGHSSSTRLLLSPLPLTDRLERAFAAQESELPAATRTVLLAAAADDNGSLPEALATASAMAGTDVTAEAIQPAVTAGLVEIAGPGLRFRHPLIRSAVYQAADVSRRRAAHTALAGLLADSPDRQAWHRSAAALGPDEQVAADIEAAAVRAERRGAIAIALDAYQRAAQLSEDTASRARRLLIAAEFALGAGRPDLGRDLLSTAESLDLADGQRAWAAWKREIFTSGGWSGTAKIDAVVRLAERMRATGQTSEAANALVDIAMRCYWGNPGQEFRSAVITAAERLDLPGTDPELVLILGCVDPVQRGARVNAALGRITPDAGNPLGTFYAGHAAGTVWAWDRALPLLDVAVDGLRNQGRLGVLVQALVTQAWAAVHLARLPAATAAAGEAERLAAETGQGHWVNAAMLARAIAAAAAGDTGAAGELAHQAETAYLTMGALPMLSLVQFARGRGAILNQQYATGFAHLRRILDPADVAHHPFIGTWGLADLIEAALQTGDRSAARSYLDQLESLSAQTSGPLLMAATAYARPLAADGETAEQLYIEALTGGLSSWPDYRSRLLLRYGEWLRRQRRTTQARALLREARDGFDALRFTSLADRARAELRAAGESSSRGAPQPWDELTAQELQIARMAADGLSNREIGQQLFISHRTVSAHLYRIFPKLGVTSRGQLRAALPS